MERINGADTVDIGGGRRGFRAQNAQAGVSGTEVTDTFLNDVQEELCKVIEASGIVLDEGNQQQLYEALLRIVAPGFGNRFAWMPVKSVTISEPPDNAVIGDAFVIPGGASGAWEGHDQSIAEWTASGWHIFTPRDGHGASLPDGRVFLRINGEYREDIALSVQSGKWNFAVASGTLNALTASISPAPLGYASMVGCMVHILPVKTNSGPSTLNLNGLGAKAIKSGGSELRGGEIADGCVCTFVFDGEQWQYVGVVQQRVSIPTTIFVNPETGNDTNNGASAGAAFKTLQRAVDVVARMYLEDVDVTIQCAPSVNYKKVKLRQFSGSGSVLIIGDRTTPANCRLTDAGNCFNNSGVTGYSVYGFRLESTGVGGGEISTHFAVVGGQLSVGDMEYGPSTQYHLYASDGGVIITSHNQKIVGVSSRHAVAVNNSTLRASSPNQPKLTVAVSGAFVEFVRAERGSVIDFAYYSSITVTGTITGIRAMAITNGIVNTSGGGNNYFPGNAAPVTQTGGQYI
ncbi:MAG: DUF2793 domain-containing protein [Brucella anthropi]